MSTTSTAGYAPFQDDASFNKSLQQNATQAARTQTMKKQANETGQPVIIEGAAVFPDSWGFGNASDSSGSEKSGGSVSASSGDFLSTAKDAQGLAKDMAEFQVGINAKQGEQDFGFRDREAQRIQTFGLQNKEADFGNTQALQGQQIGGTQKLEETRQGSETGRLNSQLKNQRDMQDAEFGNQTNQRSQSASLALSGFKR